MTAVASRRDFDRGTFLGKLPPCLRREIWKVLLRELSSKDLVMVDMVYNVPEQSQVSIYQDDEYYDQFEWPSDDDEDSHERISKCTDNFRPYYSPVDSSEEAEEDDLWFI